MNSKKTNRLVAILNVIGIISIYILYFGSKYLTHFLGAPADGSGSAFSIFNDNIITFLINNIQIVLAMIHGCLSVFNIICAVQNRKNRKLFFWQLVFGIYQIFGVLNTTIFLDYYDVSEWVTLIVSNIIPMIFALINLILIKKNKPKVIQVISYVGVIIWSVLSIFDIIGTYWEIVAIVMQFIYIHYQEKDIVESKERKCVNIILYYVIQLILVLIFAFIVLYSLIATKIYEWNWEKDLEDLQSKILTMEGVTNNRQYIPVEKDYKYGFIDTNGEEKIQCEYDRITFFTETEIEGKKCNIALGKKDDKFYIISKSGDNIVIEGELETFFKRLYDYFWELVMTNMFNEEADNRIAYINTFDMLFQAMMKEEENNFEEIEINNKNNTITLNTDDYDYYYNFENYSMKIEPIYDDIELEDYYDDNYYYDDSDDTYYYNNSHYEETKYNVTITKKNGEEESNIVYLPGIDEYHVNLDTYEYEPILETFSNGYIEFETEDKTKRGWYDENGNMITIPSSYEIEDIKDNKVFLYNENIGSIVIDMSGRTLLQARLLYMCGDTFLVKNNKDKMVLLDENLRTITDEYDKIIPNVQIDISPSYSSYYQPVY